MAELNRVTVETLRYYDRIDLLKPCYVDAATGYRYYNINQSAKLDMIRYMQSLEMPLQTIHNLFLEADEQDIQKMLIHQQTLIRKRIQELKRMRRANARAIKNYDRYFEIRDFGKVQVEREANREIFVYDCGTNVYSNNFDSFEYTLRKLKVHVALNHLPMHYFCNIGTITRQNRLDFHNLQSSELFLFVNDDFNVTENVEVLPSGTYCCIYFNNYYDEFEYALKMEEYINRNGYRITGDYVCEVVTELPVRDNCERNMIIRIQIPVKKI